MASQARQLANAYLVYASQEARDSIRGWLDAAATAWGVQSLVVTLPEDVRADLLAAQAAQVMVNPARRLEPWSRTSGQSPVARRVERLRGS